MDGRRKVKDNENENRFPEKEIEDVQLFRLLLTPTELYVLKYFVYQFQPVNVRSIYSSSIHMLFFYSFSSKSQNLIEEKYFKMYLSCLRRAGYGTESLFMSLQKKEKIMEKYSTPKYLNMSTTKLTEVYYNELVSNKIKVPSYDKIKKIVEDFTKQGILSKKKTKEEGTLYYTLTPEFYNSIKKRKEEFLLI